MYLSYKRRFANTAPPAPLRSSPSRDLGAIDRLCVDLDESSKDNIVDVSTDKYERFFSAPIERDLDKYLYNPLLWWKERVEAYPTLSRMAFDLLSCPPTSCDYERAFSAASDCYSAERSRLRDEIGEAQMVLASWLRAGVIDLQGMGGTNR